MRESTVLGPLLFVTLVVLLGCIPDPSGLDPDDDGDGYTVGQLDCDDTDPGIYPGAEEICDGRDQDCDGSADEGAIDAVRYYDDHDGDGFGNDDAVSLSCDVVPLAAEVGGDCDDSNAAVYPLADEDCNGRDEDCDGVADEGLPTLVYYPDADSDGFGDAGHEGTVDCAPPEIGWVATHGDCDDADNAVHPSATETCDGVDQDCDGHIDDGLPSATWYEDADGDGYGVAGSKGVYDCAPPDPTWVEDAGDCDDEDPGVHPDQVDGCDGVDTDCDGEIDDDMPRFWPDADGDGYGDDRLGAEIGSCDSPEGYVIAGGDGDCDDGDPTAYPGADELCDDVDTDCDGDPADPHSLDVVAFYLDTDGDGFGTPTASLAACPSAPPPGCVADSSDCDDGNAGIYPGAAEYCDLVDTDCDGETYDDHSVDIVTWWIDDDGDGVGVPGGEVVDCLAPGSGYVPAGLQDCDDAEPASAPDLVEVCGDGIDNDCSGDGSGCLPVGGAVATLYGARLAGAPGDEAATSITTGDLDGDGLAEVILGAGAHSGGVATLHIVGAAGSPPSGDVDLDTGAYGTIRAPAGDPSPSAVALGDLDGDGVLDLAMASPSDGAVYAFVDPPSGAVALDGASDFALVSTSYQVPFDRVALLDFNGTGTADLIAVATEVDPWSFVYLYEDLAGPTPVDDHDSVVVGILGLGTAVDGGDLTGDGQVDVVLGSSGEEAVYVSTLAGGLSLDVQLSAQPGDGGIGSTAVVLGDVDGDGIDDLFLGSDDGSGPAYVVSGSPTLADADTSVATVTLTPTKSDGIGAAAAGCGDLDGDGRADFLVGAVGADGGVGSVVLAWGGLTGVHTGATVGETLTGAPGETALGQSLACGHDVDGDGSTDLVLGGRGAADEGVAYLIWGLQP